MAGKIQVTVAPTAFAMVAGDFVEGRVGSVIWVFIGVDEAVFVGLHVGVFQVGRNTASVASSGRSEIAVC